MGEPLLSGICFVLAGVILICRGTKTFRASGFLVATAGTNMLGEPAGLPVFVVLCLFLFAVLVLEGSGSSNKADPGEKGT